VPEAPKEQRDLTAIFIPKDQRSEEEIRALAARFGEVWLRVAQLPAVSLTQIEILDGPRGLPSEDPQLVGELAKSGRAAFVHINHSAPQALVHVFENGQAQPGWMGTPGEEFEAKLMAAVGCSLEQLHAADDGSRLGLGVAASNTIALVRGRSLQIPPGTPTGMNSFAFHDRGNDLGDGTRVAPFAYDPRSADSLFKSPARELAAQLSTARKSPLEGARSEVIALLAQMGDRSLTAKDEIALRALELCALDSAFVFAGGDRQYFWDHRVLPMFSLSDGEPQFDSDEMEELDESESILEAMVDILPYGAPPGGEGSIFSNLGPGELLPLAPWADGDEYSGSIFRVEPERLLKLVRSLDGGTLNSRIERFEKAWFRASRSGAAPEGDQFTTWRRFKAEDGQKDVERFVVDWTELRIVLELAHANQLAVGLLFYE
jgi:hypothetical protein